MLGISGTELFVYDFPGCDAKPFGNTPIDYHAFNYYGLVAEGYTAAYFQKKDIARTAVKDDAVAKGLFLCPNDDCDCHTHDRCALKVSRSVIPNLCVVVP